MTIFTDIPTRRSSLDEYQTPLGDVLGATAKEALLYSPLSSATRSGELIKAQEGQPKGFLGFGGRYEPETSLLRPDDARKRVHDAGVELTIPEEGIRGGALDMLIERKREENRRNDILARGPGGIVAGAARFAVSMGASVLDPLNVAAAFIPVVGEARYAAMLERAGSAFARTAVRAGVGAVEGGVGAALVEPLIYSAATQEQADYDLNGSLLNIGAGTVLGGGLHVGVGAASDVFSRGSKWWHAKADPAEAVPRLLESFDFKTRETALRTGVAQALSGEQINIDQIVQAQARRLLSTHAPAPIAQRKPVNLTRFLANLGGLQDQKGEVRALDLHNLFVPGSGKLVKETGKTLDYAREAVAEAGYFDHIYGDPETATEKSTIADLLEALDQDARGQRIFAGEDGQRVDAQSSIEEARVARDTLRQRLDRLTQEMETELPDEIVIRAAEHMGDGLEPADALERSILEDYYGNGSPIPLERADGTEFEVPFFDEPGGFAPQRRAYARGDEIGRYIEARDPGTDGQAVRNFSPDQSRQIEPRRVDADDPDSGLSEALEDAQGLADALGFPDIVSRELAYYDALNATAEVYGRAVAAAATCQLRRGI